MNLLKMLQPISETPESSASVEDLSGERIVVEGKTVVPVAIGSPKNPNHSAGR